VIIDQNDLITLHKCCNAAKTISSCAVLRMRRGGFAMRFLISLNAVCVFEFIELSAATAAQSYILLDRHKITFETFKIHTFGQLQ
jgi:hypothetical protein